jgi:hypothetical protein
MLLDRSFTVSREAARALAGRMLGGTPAPLSGSIAEAPAHQGRGSAQLALADRIINEARCYESRVIVDPDLEPIDPDVEGDADEPWEDLEPEDPSISSQLKQDEEEDEEDEPRDEAGRFSRQDDEEQPPPEDEEEQQLAAKGVEITIIDVDEEIEDGDNSDEEDEPAYQLPQVPA